MIVKVLTESVISYTNTAASAFL